MSEPDGGLILALIEEIMAELGRTYWSVIRLKLEISPAGPEGPPEQAADTRKRGPTARVDAASEKPKRKPCTDGSDRRDSLDDQDKRIGYSEADLDLCIEDATHLNLTESSRWQDLRDHGCDDARILEVLRAILPQTPTYTIPSLTPPARPGFSACGGSVPKLWIGSRQSKDQPPTLSGLAFADRVRIVLDLPRAPVEDGESQKAKGKRKAAR